MKNNVDLPYSPPATFIEQLFLFSKSVSSLSNFLGARGTESARSSFIEKLMEYRSFDKRLARRSLIELQSASRSLFIFSLDLYKLFVPEASGLTFLHDVDGVRVENFVSFVRHFSSLIISLRRDIVHLELQKKFLQSSLSSRARLCCQLGEAERAIKSFLEVVGSDVPPREDMESLRSSERSRSGGETLLPRSSSLVGASLSLPSQTPVPSGIVVTFSTSSKSPAKRVVDLSEVTESVLCSSYLASPKVPLSSRPEFMGSVPQSGDEGLKSQETSLMGSESHSRTSRESLRSSERSRGESRSHFRTSMESLRSSERSRGESRSRSRTSRESLRSSERSRGESRSHFRTSMESLRSSERSRGESRSRSRTSRESLRSSERSRGESRSHFRTSMESLRGSVSCQDYGQASYLSYYISDNSPFPPQRFAYGPPFPPQRFAYGPPFPPQRFAYGPPFPPQRFAYGPPFPRLRSLPNIGGFPSHVRSSLSSQHVSDAASSASSVSGLRSTDNPVSLPSDVPSGRLECVQASQEAKDIMR
ncbi:hypothetical protein OUY_05655 [Wolbachia endosymbiont of Leptopilina clavipes]|uniref:hypothetical protein n=1 Tax=Wolbachia endosymbiont of Leptopilina clavipes TaxID=260213 RepID=UPI00111ACD1C|nr:hypothetical protein [Wolbachia endosymbiont of Leptopilina clavipes]TNK93540.1 hypothetical protein OUY_05655 [Wolbachia endosymbiont of Leptopilina clavipes]